MLGPSAFCIVTTNDATFFEHIPENIVDVHNFVDLFSDFDAEYYLPHLTISLDGVVTSMAMSGCLAISQYPTLRNINP